MTHEERFFQDEVVGGKHDDRRLRVSNPDPVGGKEHTGGGPSIGWLGKHLKLRTPGKRGSEITRMAGERHDHGSLRRNQQGYTIQGLAQ